MGYKGTRVPLFYRGNCQGDFNILFLRQISHESFVFTIRFRSVVLVFPFPLIF